MNKLRQEASPDGFEWVSSGDALVVLLWRSIMRAWFFPENLEGAPNTEELTVTVAVNDRKLLSSPLPPVYIGNVLLCCIARLSIGMLFLSRISLADTALKTRRNVDLAKEQQVLEDAI